MNNNIDHVFKSKKYINLKIDSTLKNTYMLLSLTIIFSAFIALFTAKFIFVKINFILTLLIFYGLLFLINYFKASIWGLFFVFFLTGFMGYSLSFHLTPLFATRYGMEMITFSLFLTGFIFAILSMYVLITKKNFNFLNGFLFVGFFIILICIIVNLFFNIPLLGIIISAFFILFSSAAILYETSNIVNGGETNYILATISLYLQIYNMFVSILSIFNFFSDKD